MIKIDSQIKFNRFPQIPGELEQGLSRHIPATLKDIRDGAESRSRRDTGRMAEGWQISESTGEVFNDVEYVKFHEYGTATIPSQAMIRPAVEVNRNAFNQGIAEILRNLGK